MKLGEDMQKVIIVGAGLAGSEAAYQIAKRGVEVDLYEMRPQKMTPAHQTGDFAELICSNSFKAMGKENATGILKEEMHLAHSLIIEIAQQTKIPAGNALAVDRRAFSALVTKKLQTYKNINIHIEEIQKIPRAKDAITIIATGPLTTDALAKDIVKNIGEDYLYFYDAAAPIIDKESIDFEKVYFASRYNKGTADYINCPLTKKEYENFYEALVSAKRVSLHTFEKEIFFEGCMPIEVLAKRGTETLLFGPLKPVGLENPKTGATPYAVVQLRRDNLQGTSYNMVGFQTNLTWGEQKRVFSLIPGLEQAEFLRYGVMHRNTFLASPKILLPTLEKKDEANIFFAGQITGVEGYVESAATGFVAAINALRRLQGKKPLALPKETAHGALCHYITETDIHNFQPMHINFGILPPITAKMPKQEKKIKKANLAIKTFEEILPLFNDYHQV